MEAEARKRLIERLQDPTLPEDPELLIDEYRKAVLLEAATWLDGGAPTAAKWLRDDYLGARS